MTAAPIRLLLLEDNPGDARLVQVALAEHAAGGFAVTWVERLADALARIASDHFDAVLSDLGLPDSRGLATAQAIAARAPALPLVVLTGSGDDQLGPEAIRHGAQDYLVKGDLSGAMIARTLRYAIERKRLEIGLRTANEELERRVAERTADLEAAIKKLRESEDRYGDLVESSQDLICTHDLEGKLLSVNAAAVRLTGYAQEALLRMNMADLLTRGTRDGFAAYLAEIRTTGAARGLMRIRTASGETRWWEYNNTLRTQDVAAPMVRGMAQDITERKRATEVLQEVEERYEYAVRGSQAAIWDRDLVRNRYYRSPRLEEMLGFAEGEFAPSREAFFALVHPEDLQRIADVERRRIAQSGVSHGVEFRLRRKDGRYLWCLSTGRATLDAEGRLVRVSGSVIDIHERKEAEARFRSLFENMLNGFAYCRMQYDEHGRPADFVYLDVNGAFERLTGLKDVVGKQVTEVIPGIREANPEIFEIYGRVASTGTPETFEIELKPLRQWFSISVYSPERGYFVAVFDVITERKRAEQALRAAEEQFRGLVEQSIAGIYIVQDRKLAYANPRFAEIFGYGSAEEMIDRDPVSMLVTEKDRETVAESIRQRIEGEVASTSYEFTGLRKDGSTIDVGVHGARATHLGRPAVIGLMQDISEKKRAEEQIQRHVIELEKAFMSTVGVATTLSEMRDPYTAGHERRVAELAVAIAAELGFDARRLEGMRVAGCLHDLGKITVPTEILAKPGRLTPMELALIKEHAQASYDILKDVEFPWPVAQIALQHHERLDGSGYPQGLKGEAMLFEARIMSVADVVEAMSSHRPYRAGLGIDKALAEIERGRGTAYDPVVADACLTLFRERGYTIPA